jgi:hypothetical protein
MFFHAKTQLGMLSHVLIRMSGSRITAMRSRYRKAYLLPALAAGYLEMTLPGQPKSRLQRYRLTETGRRARDLLSLPRRKSGSRR